MSRESHLKVCECNADALVRRFYRDLKDKGLEGLLPENGRVLDAGCGYGYGLQKMHQKNPHLELYGVDISASFVGESAALVPPARIIQADFQALPFEDRFFDCVISSNIFDHCFGYREPFYPDRMIMEVYRILRKGGGYFAHDINIREPGEKMHPQLEILERIFQRATQNLFIKTE